MRMNMPGIQVTNFYKQGADYHVVRDNGSNNWLMLFTVNGSGSCGSGEHRLDCGTGDVVIYPYGVPHNYRTSGEVWEFHWAHFIPAEEWLAALKLPAPDQGIISLRVLHPDRFQRIEHTFRLLHQQQFVKQAYRHALAMNLMEFIWIMIAQEWEDQQGEQSGDPR